MKLLLLGGAAVFHAAVAQACQDLITNTALLNELDSEVGDGDCGNTLANGARCMCQSVSSYYVDYYFVIRCVASWKEYSRNKCMSPFCRHVTREIYIIGMRMVCVIFLTSVSVNLFGGTILPWFVFQKRYVSGTAWLARACDSHRWPSASDS